MAIHLPNAFQEKMSALLDEEYNAFLHSYEESPWAGLRVNTLKITLDHMLDLTPFELSPIPWCETGFYTQEGIRPGKHPYYHAGLYYIQEPSAMAPVELLEVKPGDAVLDLCAAPGGKSTQIAAKLQGEGLLISNDLSQERTKALAKNLELYGVRNAIVLNENPAVIADRFPVFFDKILIDAPCSGEGMFRKDEDMTKQWDGSSPLKYAAMQRDILQSAALMLKPGGRLVYSTCTFSPEENEAMIAAFITSHPHFHVVPVGGTGSFASGQAEWVDSQDSASGPIGSDALEEVKGTARLWPHLIQGEGHFVAVLQHDGTVDEAVETERYQHEVSEKQAGRAGGSRKDSLKAVKGKGKKAPDKRGKQPVEEDPLAGYQQFIQEHITFEPKGYPIVYGSHIYISPLPLERLDKLKVIRPGWNMGHNKNGRFVPGHPLATALQGEECCRRVSLSSVNGEAVKYLKGETLEITEERIQCSSDLSAKGVVLVCIDGYSAGWGKWQNGMLKNEYPAGWRWTSV